MNNTNSNYQESQLGSQLHSNKLAKAGEIVLLFLAGFAFIKVLSPLAEGNLVMKQAIVWGANIIMLSIVWIGLRLRGESWQHFGISTKSITWRGALKVFLLSLLVFVLAISGFMGLALGICYVKMKRRLWIMIIAHAYMDITLMIQLYLNN